MFERSLSAGGDTDTFAQALLCADQITKLSGKHMSTDAEQGSFEVEVGVRAGTHAHECDMSFLI